MNNFTWSRTNGKLVKTAKHWEERYGTAASFLSFNIPQLRSETGAVTCPYAGDCAKVCYASQGRMAMSQARSARERNLSAIKRLRSTGKIADAILEDLSHKQVVTHIRIHDSGDFYNRSYYRAWVQAAKERPDLTFYAYTKSIPLIEWDSHPRNFRIVQSLGGKRDHEVDLDRPHSRIFVSHDERRALGYCDGNVDDMPAVLGYKKIGLVYHGTRNLDDVSRVRLSIMESA